MLSPLHSSSFPHRHSKPSPSIIIPNCYPSHHPCSVLLDHSHHHAQGKTERLRGGARVTPLLTRQRSNLSEYLCNLSCLVIYLLAVSGPWGNSAKPFYRPTLLLSWPLATAEFYTKGSDHNTLIQKATNTFGITNAMHTANSHEVQGQQAVTNLCSLSLFEILDRLETDLRAT